MIALAVKSGDIDMSSAQQQSYRGYYYRILISQGPAAPGGALNYIDDRGHMTRGWALIAWPSAYDSSGIMTFITSRDGIVYQQDFGDDTAEEVAKITAFDPGEGWAPADDVDQALIDALKQPAAGSTPPADRP
jgi:hypothetical protein